MIYCNASGILETDPSTDNGVFVSVNLDSWLPIAFITTTDPRTPYYQLPNNWFFVTHQFPVRYEGDYV